MNILADTLDACFKLLGTRQAKVEWVGLWEDVGWKWKDDTNTLVIVMMCEGIEEEEKLCRGL